MSVVSDLLAKSREAHTRYRHSAGHVKRDGSVSESPNDRAAREAVVDALEFRKQAEAFDPDHDDGAWSLDLAAMKGQQSAALIKFYQSFFTA